MKRIIIGIASAAVAFAMWPAQGALAQTITDHCSTSLSDPACKNVLLCEEAIQKAASKYYFYVEGKASKLIDLGQAGKLKKLPKIACTGGPKSGKSCHSDADCLCSSALSTTVGGTPAHCECAPVAAKNPGSGDYLKAQGILVKTILSKCSTAGKVVVDPAALGLSNIPNCNISNTAAPNDAYHALATCIEESAAGDRHNAIISDSLLLPVVKGTGNSGNGTLPQGQGSDANPRMITSVQGSTMLQIGTIAGSDEPTAGGSTTYASLSSCSGGTVPDGSPCVNNSDCGKGGTCSNADCGVSSSDTNFTCSGATCCQGFGLGPYGHTLTVTGACSDTAATCLWSTTDEVGNTGTGAVVTVDLASGNFEETAPITSHVYVTALNPGASNCSSIDVCPVCRATDITGAKVKPGICEGQCLHAVGSPPLPALDGNVKCNKDTDCTGAGDWCSVKGHGLASGANTTNVPCDQPDGTATYECLGVKADGTAATNINVPVPFVTGTGSGSAPNLLLDSPTYAAINSGTSDAPSGVFCGSCSNDANEACQDNEDCGAGNTCCFLGTEPGCSGFTVPNPGFNGDTTVTAISANGSPSQYTPTVGGAFCAGSTGSSGLDADAGVPGPVRFIGQQYNAFTFTKD
jgi:hypothetical protein